MAKAKVNGKTESSESPPEHQEVSCSVVALLLVAEAQSKPSQEQREGKKKNEKEGSVQHIQAAFSSTSSHCTFAILSEMIDDLYLRNVSKIKETNVTSRLNWQLGTCEVSYLRFLAWS